MIAEKIVTAVITEKIVGFSSDTSFISSSRDIFNARLQGFISETEKWLEICFRVHSAK